MRLGDRLIRDVRIAQAVRHIEPGSRVLDIGCHDGALFRRLGDNLAEGVGYDPDLPSEVDDGRFRLRRGAFPDCAATESGAFDAVTALAVLEHIPQADQPRFAQECYRLLRPGGRLVLTVPAPAVDSILDVLMKVKLLNGMEAEQHYGFSPEMTVPLMEGAGFRLLLHSRFEVRLNHLFVFYRPSEGQSAAG